MKVELDKDKVSINLEAMSSEDEILIASLVAVLARGGVFTAIVHDETLRDARYEVEEGAAFDEEDREAIEYLLSVLRIEDEEE